MLLLKELPKYECLRESSKRYPDLDPSAMEAFLHLLRTSTEMIDAMDDLLADYEISQGRFVVMILLNRDPETPVNPADLADRAKVTRATMTGLIDTLERDGFVKREHASEDRRMMLVRLTNRGRSYLDRVLPDYFRRIATLMGQLATNERKTLVALMNKIGESMSAMRA